MRCSFLRFSTFACGIALIGTSINNLVQAEDPTKTALAEIAKLKVGPKDWPQWGGSPVRNNTPSGEKIPVEWDVASGKNIRWSMPLGSETYGNPTVANGKVYVGTNNGNGYLKETYPNTLDLGVLLCFNENEDPTT